jgi:hypothetical protein
MTKLRRYWPLALLVLFVGYTALGPRDTFWIGPPDNCTKHRWPVWMGHTWVFVFGGELDVVYRQKQEKFWADNPEYKKRRDEYHAYLDREWQRELQERADAKRNRSPATGKSRPADDSR